MRRQDERSSCWQGADSDPTNPEELIREALRELGQAQEGLLEMLTGLADCGRRVEAEPKTKERRLLVFQRRGSGPAR